MELVPAESRGEKIPCRQIPLNAQGETLDSLYRYADRPETEEVFRNWLLDTIETLEKEPRAPNPIGTAAAIPKLKRDENENNN
jgi:hypothetical protein